MARTARAAVAVAPGVTEIRDLPVPEVTPTTGLLRVEVTGVCGSDWGYYHDLVRARGPVVLGHETVGTIERAGREALARWGLREGDRVALEEYVPCGHCEFCRTGDFRLCEATDWRTGGLRYGATALSVEPGLWGGFAQVQHLAFATVFHRVPDGMAGAHAALALPVANGIEWTYLHGRAGPGECVVIQGPGQQGLSCVVAAKEAGASLVIVTGLGTPTDRRRLALARDLGADHVIDIESEDLLERVSDLTGGHMADLVVDCASGGPASVVSAIRLARKKGRVILGGQKRKPIPEFESDRIIARFLTVKGMRGHSYESVELALGLIAKDRHGVTRLSTHRFPLSQTDRAIRALAGEGAEGAVHSTVDPWSDP
ncbi:MAG: zinc-binding dehydrogenase [Rhodospirillales bacterium]|jgi:threonine dehydrogenase-like Zn-dependent dehydrogenase